MKFSRPFKNPLNSKNIGYKHLGVLLHPIICCHHILDSNILHDKEVHAKKKQDSSNSFLLKS